MMIGYLSAMSSCGICVPSFYIILSQIWCSVFSYSIVCALLSAVCWSIACATKLGL